MGCYAGGLTLSFGVLKFHFTAEHAENAENATLWYWNSLCDLCGLRGGEFCWSPRKRARRSEDDIIVSVMISLIERHREQIAELCRRYRLKRLELFGSAASGNFDPIRSDVDFFYEFDPSDMDHLADRFFDLKAELEQLLGVNVDLVSAPDVTNLYFLQVANRHRLTLYAA
jgi:predicted nucleotidyltransferase